MQLVDLLFFHIDYSQSPRVLQSDNSSFERAENFGKAGLFGKAATTDEGGKFLDILTVSIVNMHGWLN